MATDTLVETTLAENAGTAGQASGKPPSTNGIAAAVASGSGGKSESSHGNSAGQAPSGGKRGRPPIHGHYSAAMGSNGKNAVRTAGESPLEKSQNIVGPEVAPRVVIPPQLLAKCVKETLTACEFGAEMMIQGIGKRAGLTDKEMEPQLKQTQLGDTRKDLIAELTPYALAEHGIDAQMSPTVLICCMMGPWSIGCVTAFFTLTKIAKEKLELEKKKEKAKENAT